MSNMITMTVSPPRHLFDVEFVLDYDCDPSFYDEATRLDNNLSTYATNYVIGVVGLLAALWHYCHKTSHWVVAYFAITALGFSVAGVRHQVTYSRDNHPYYNLYWITEGVLVVLAVLALQMFALTRSTKLNKKILPTIVLVSLAVLVIGLSVGLTTFLPVGAYLAAALLVLALQFGCYVISNRDYFVSLGCCTYVVGLLVQGILDGRCGIRGYENCWEDCPLADPLKFNSNAIFHILVVIGLLFQAMGTYDYYSPDTDHGSTSMRSREDIGAIAGETPADDEESRRRLEFTESNISSKSLII